MKFRLLILSAFTILIMCLNVGLSISTIPVAEAAAVSTVTLALSTSSTVVGGSIEASGTADANTWVSIKVLDNTQSIVFYDAVKSDANGDYSDTFTVPSVSPGTLTVVAGYGSNVTDASLAVGTNSQPTDNQVPTWPSGSSLKAANVTQTGLTLSWTTAEDNTAVTGYKIYQGSTCLSSISNSTLTYSVSGLNAGTQYTFRVQAGDAAGNWSTDGPNVSLTTAVPITTPQQPPQWPTGAAVTVSLNSTQATLTWPAATDNVGVDHYEILRSSNGNYVVIGTVSGSITTYSDTTVPAGSGSTSTWEVIAFDMVGYQSTPITGQPTNGQSLLNFDVSQSYIVTVDTSSATATDIAPIAGSTSVPVNPTIMLYFDRGVTNTSVWSTNQSCITLQDSSGASVPINVFWLQNQSGTTYIHDIFFTPLSSLTPGKTYKITISKNLIANNGHTLGENDGNMDQTVTFTVVSSGSSGSSGTAGEITTTNVAVAADGSNKSLSITNNTPSDVTITVPNSVTNATLNISSLLNAPVSGTVTTNPLPAMTITANTSLSTSPVQVNIPAGETINADANNWSGTINVPTVVANNSVTVTPDSGNTATVNAVVEVGFGDVPLTLSKPVRILIPGAAGKNVGYVRNGVFTKITSLLTQDSGDSLATGADGYLYVGSDLVIWTRHFTKFVAYTETAGQTASSASGAPSTVIYQDVNGHYISANYLNALTSAQMKTALAKTLSSAELANLPIFVTTDNGNVINYTAAIAKGETYAQALTDSAVNQASAPTATYQMNADGSVTSIASAVTVISVGAINVTTDAGTAPELPATVSAVLSDGTTQIVAVTWANVAPSQYAAAGTFTVTGTIANATVMATAKVMVIGAPVTVTTASVISITYQDANGYYVSANYLNALSNAQMKTALAKALSSAELANLPIFITTDNGNVINYTAAIAKGETYAQALTDSAVNQASAPAATYQMNADGSVTPMAPTVSA